MVPLWFSVDKLRNTFKKDLKNFTATTTPSRIGLLPSIRMYILHCTIHKQILQCLRAMANMHRVVFALAFREEVTTAV